MVVLALICHDEHRRIIQAPFNMLPSWAAPHTTAFCSNPCILFKKAMSWSYANIKIATCTFDKNRSTLSVPISSVR
jgi:hypothetical protein